MGEKMNVLMIGSGGREHALAWKLAQSRKVARIYVAPGNAGCCGAKLMAIPKNELDIFNVRSIGHFCTVSHINLVVVGPEEPLSKGFIDSLRNLCPGMHCFGPTREAARLETSKSFAKKFMQKYSLPTAEFETFHNIDEACQYINNSDRASLVVKADGLAAGKGVIVAENRIQACQAARSMLVDRKFGDAGQKIVIEERLEGEEVSALCFTDGFTLRMMPISRDYKRRFEADVGVNTGGMGAYAPCTDLTGEQLAEIEQLLSRTIVSMREVERQPYQGVLYIGLMLTNDGPKLLEFNCRFGDPETQVILPLLDTDLFDICTACSDGKLDQIEVTWKKGKYTCGIVLISDGYPGTYSKGKEITYSSDFSSNTVLFHAGTAMSEHGALITNGGRVFCAVSIDDSLELARKSAFELANMVNFDGKQMRKDIGNRNHDPIANDPPSDQYLQSGVNISAGNRLVDLIKISCQSTLLPGTGQIGGFGAEIDLKTAGFQDPLLVLGMDGVGTKLEIANSIGKFDTIGIDLVAMCANDVICQGAEPLAFLDYYVSGKLHLENAVQVLNGICIGCKQARCALVGGETAEMPGVYGRFQWDLAGCIVGVRDRFWPSLPMSNHIIVGDKILAISSSGLHSNGFSLVRKIIAQNRLSYTDASPWESGKSIGESLLIPTRIYTESLMAVIKSGTLKALAHITGGGLLENIPRIIPDSVSVRIDAKLWEIPHVFKWLHTFGGIATSEMSRVFNCGIGMIAIVADSEAENVTKIVAESGERVFKIGSVVRRDEGPRVCIEHLTTCLYDSRFEIAHEQVSKTKVGILISGSGTNMKAIIERSLLWDSSFEVVLVISSKENAPGLNIASNMAIPIRTIPCIGHFDDQRRLYEEQIHLALVANHVHLVCLAGFMRILTVWFVNRWTDRLLNTHPSLLPSFKGDKAVALALASGVRLTGCTVHFVVPEVDSGAIVEQAVVAVDPNDTVQSLQDRIKSKEHEIYPEAVQSITSGRTKIRDGKLIRC